MQKMKMQDEKKILFVDSDEGGSSTLANYVTQYGFDSEYINDINVMHKLVNNQLFDLVVLENLQLGKDGISITRDLRRISSIPIIILTQYSSTYDRIIGLESGADDFLEKPCEPRELIARIRSVLRRNGYKKTTIEINSNDSKLPENWRLEEETRCLYEPDGRMILLSQTEIELLNAFMQAPGKLLSRNQILQKIYGRVTATERSVDLQIYRLRQKILQNSKYPEFIRTVRGKGYILNTTPTPAAHLEMHCHKTENRSPTGFCYTR